HAELLCRFWLWCAIRAAIEKPAHDRTDDDHEGALRGQINAQTDGERRHAHVPRRPCEDLIQQDDADAEQRADADQTPVDVRSDDALCERGYEARLRRR